MPSRRGFLSSLLAALVVPWKGKEKTTGEPPEGSFATCVRCRGIAGYFPEGDILYSRFCPCGGLAPDGRYVGATYDSYECDDPDACDYIAVKHPHSLVRFYA